MPDYTLLTLECWSCPEKFAVFTELSNHHLDAHERHLRGESVATWLSAWLTRDECGLLSSAPPAPWLQDAAEPVPGGEEAAPAPCCRTCGSLVLDIQEHLDAQLCGGCFAAGVLAYCTFCGENHPEHLRAGGRGCATWHQGGAKPRTGGDGGAKEPARDAMCTCGCVYDSHCTRMSTGDLPEHPCLTCDCASFTVPVETPPPDATVPCFCGHAESNHTDRTWRLPCCSEGCPCSQFTATSPSLSALETFVGRCRAEGLSYNVFDARLLLDTLGVPPDALTVEWEAGMSEALQRWRDRVTAPAPPLRRMTNDVARGNPYHYHEHVENGYCAMVSCQPIEEARAEEAPAPLPRLMYNPMERWGWRHHGEHAENGYCATAQCLPKKEDL